MKRIKEVFPNLMSLVIFCLYMVFCVGQGIFVTASRRHEATYSYDVVLVVLLTETVKLILAFFCYIKDHNVYMLYEDVKQSKHILMLYLVPSFLYCIYNNLAFVNLSHFDPTTYYLLLQLRVVVTGVVFQFLFNKQLSATQWFSLILLTFGCMVQQIDVGYLKAIFTGANLPEGPNYQYYLLILLQTVCSCFAGVYNERLLKGEALKVNIFVQNIFMYLDSIFWNVMVLTYQGNLISTFSNASFAPILKPLVIIIIFNNSLIGITTSLFLKNLNSILKTFASALELLFTAVLCWIIFNIQIKFNTVVAIAIVSYSVYLYSKNPVDNRAKSTEQTDENQRKLLETV